MASLDEMLRAGYTPVKSSAEQVAGLLNGVNAQAQKNQQQQQADTAEQAKLYITLREAGYSKEDATSRVQRSYKSTGFIQDLMSGKGNNVFNPPTQDDDVDLKTQKARADIKKTEAETKSAEAEVPLKGAKTDYYKQGGAKRTVIDKMTPNQLQARVKYLESIKGTLDNEEDNANVDQELSYVNQKIQEISGFKKPDAEAPPAAAAKTGSVVMTGPDGKKYRIPAANVEKARKRGFK